MIAAPLPNQPAPPPPSFANASFFLSLIRARRYIRSPNVVPAPSSKSAVAFWNSSNIPIAGLPRGATLPASKHSSNVLRMKSSYAYLNPPS